LDEELLLQIYNALCHCLINYGICSWGGSGKTYLIEAERAQRGLLKVLLALPYRYPTTELYKRANVLSVRKTYILQCLRRYHRTADTVNKNKRTYLSRIPLVRSELAKRHYDFRGPHLYNRFNKIIKIHEVNQFQAKTEIIKWLKNYDYQACEELLV
jgi:hypothetical protein